MAPTFVTKSDAMPKNFLGITRTKYIHSVGAIGKCKFVSTGDHPYTGIFEGADYGFCRLSAASEPNIIQDLAPGLSLKFLRDGVLSADIMALYSVNGTPNDWNFFSKDFYNHVGPGTTLPTKGLLDKFATYID